MAAATRPCAATLSRCVRGRRKSPRSVSRPERIRRNAAELKLVALLENLDDLIRRAEEAALGYRELLDLVLEEEAGALEGRRYASRLKLSGLPHHKTFDQFELAFQPELDPKKIAELRSLRFLERRACVLLLGPPEVGKTHCETASCDSSERSRGRSGRVGGGHD